MAKLKFKDENNNFIPVVQDIKVNSSSVFDGKDANIRLKTINNQSIVGSGNINIQGGEGEYVKYSPKNYYKYNVDVQLAMEFESKMAKAKNFNEVRQLVLQYETIFDKSIYVLHLGRLAEKDLENQKRHKKPR